jgi:TPP-dependent pyruvate/acetoin dehydrogenase alpha subunit
LVHALSKDTEFRLWERMTTIRRVEEEIAARYGEQEMRCPTHLSIGQEAVPVAVGDVASPNDYAVSTHRGHAHYLGKGGNLNAMIAEIYGKETGCSKGRGGSMHLMDASVGFMGTSAIVGNSIPIGVGLGLAAKLDGGGQVSYIFLGDGAVEEGVFYESVNFAVLSKLPVIFVCENNLYSVYSPLSVRQPEDRAIWQMVQGLGANVNHTDGNDIAATLDVIQDATHRCRDGDGPWFLEFSTYRWLEHCGPNYDNDIGYRSEEEFERWKHLDPIAQHAKRLSESYPEFQAFSETAEAQIKQTVDSAFDFAKSSPFPARDSAMQGEYAEPRP